MFKIGLGVFVVFGLVICTRMETGRGITGVEVLERDTSPGGVHEYVTFLTYGPGEEYWHLAVVPTDHPVFMERQYHVMRFDEPPGVTLHWLSDTELQVTLPPHLGLPDDVPKRKVSGDVTVVYVEADSVNN